MDPFATPSAPCDPVHTGAVEVFTGGAWAPVCVADPAAAAFVAAVACRSLGFPHAVAAAAPAAVPLTQSAEPPSQPARSSEPAQMAICTGMEDSLVECEVASSADGPAADRFGGMSAYYDAYALGYDDGYGALAPGPGGPQLRCSGSTLAVVCTMFPLGGTLYGPHRCPRAQLTPPRHAAGGVGAHGVGHVPLRDTCVSETVWDVRATATQRLPPCTVQALGRGGGCRSTKACSLIPWPRRLLPVTSVHISFHFTPPPTPQHMKHAAPAAKFSLRCRWGAPAPGWCDGGHRFGACPTASRPSTTCPAANQTTASRPTSSHSTASRPTTS